MLRILTECSASVRKSLQGLDYYAAEGARAFDDLAGIVEKVYALSDLSEGDTGLLESLKAGKLYLKGDFKDSTAVIQILQHVIKTLKIAHPEIERAFFRQDNAGCYHSSSTILATQQISETTGIDITRTDFNDPQGGKVHLETDPNVTPNVMPPRRVPVAVKGKLKAELDRTPTRIDKGKYFSKADLKEGFLQVQLDEESSKLTTFQTPWGRYRWHRLPFGIAPAPEIFQIKLDQNLEGLKGTFAIADDILITGQGDTDNQANQDHDKNLQSFLHRCRERNIKLNKDKFDFKCEEVCFIGHRLTKEGLKLDPNKVNAIMNMMRPEDVPVVHRLIGMVKYLSKFLSDLSQMCEPIRKLTHKDEPWNWTEKQEQAFQNIKEAVASAPILKYFDAAKPTEGSGDASQHGIGFVLTQEDHPITYASRALTSAEQKYSQIEKELLAQVFGLEHNQQYAYGRKITLFTDHKPLVSISKKPLSATPKRLQRLLLRLHCYDVEIKYRPGSQMYLADTLSRAYQDTTTDELHRSEVEIEVECTRNRLPSHIRASVT
ncbi:hypothetical protein QZH41_006887 [Actinostola sp. cb2023]|nr:hypothetical protein QZH41_006887 [Actinostola sp. cb2023]